jgi:crotonobetainyl-CoA:carnitine CoA-transferase CaiB-like acyl-CoA transferase
MLLSDLGAEVIKIEPPGGEETRRHPPMVRGQSVYFSVYNRGKKSICLDLRSAKGKQVFAALVAKSDVVLENFRPGVMDRMGLGYEALAAEHPDLVYASLNGYGSTGPWAHRRAYAPVVGAESGLTWLQGEARGGSYANDPISHGDVYPALECLAGILAALYQRERTGRGQHVEISMAATLLSINEHVHWELADTSAEGFVASFQPGDYPVFTVGDGRSVVVSGHPAERGTFERYARAVGRPELIDDERFGDIASRVQRLTELRDELQVGAKTFPSPAELESSLAEEGLAMGVLRTVREVADSEWARQRGAIVDVPDRGGGHVRIPNSPWHFSHADVGVRGQPAYRGEHNREVLGSLCELTDAELDQLEADGVLSSRLPT